MWKFLGILVYVFTIFDVLRSRFANPSDKYIWIGIVLLLPFLGTVLWFVIGRNKRL